MARHGRATCSEEKRFVSMSESSPEQIPFRPAAAVGRAVSSTVLVANDGAPQTLARKLALRKAAKRTICENMRNMRKHDQLAAGIVNISYIGTIFVLLISALY